MGFGRMAFRMSVARCCSKPSTTCWSAASWIAASFVSANGLWNHTRRMRSPSTRGTSKPLGGRVLVHVSALSPCCAHALAPWKCVFSWLHFCYLWSFIHVISLDVRLWCGLVQLRLSTAPTDTEFTVCVRLTIHNIETTLLEWCVMPPQEKTSIRICLAAFQEEDVKWHLLCKGFPAHVLCSADLN